MKQLNASGLSLLEQAIRTNNVDIVTQLLAAGAEVNLRGPVALPEDPLAQDFTPVAAKPSWKPAAAIGIDTEAPPRAVFAPARGFTL